MDWIGRKTFKTIFILAGKNGEIYYNNINNTKITQEVLDMLSINDLLNEGDFSEKEIDDYIITAKKVIVEDREVWAITAEMHDFYDLYTDFSTGLYNRNLWEHLKSGMVKPPGNFFYSLIVIDIDNLKKCNDLLGHIAGDKSIATVAEVISFSVRENDIPIHYGGDEYIVILPNAGIAVADRIVERIRNNLETRCESEEFKIEISAGTAFSDDVDGFEQILRMADSKMYNEKRGKKKICNCVD